MAMLFELRADDSKLYWMFFCCIVAFIYLIFTFIKIGLLCSYICTVSYFNYCLYQPFKCFDYV